MTAHSIQSGRKAAAYDAEEHVAEAARLWRRGMRVEAIAAEMGMTVHAMRGLISRNEHRFSGRSERSMAVRQAGRQAGPGLAELSQRVAAAEAGGASDEELTALFGRFAAGREIPRLTGEAVTLMELRETHCRFVVDPIDGAETLFCGRQKVQGAYCALHAGLCYQPKPGARP